MKKYEVRTKNETDLTYGIWNNDMQAWQYIHEWNGTETTNLEEANVICDNTNFFFSLIS